MERLERMPVSRLRNNTEKQANLEAIVIIGAFIAFLALILFMLISAPTTGTIR